MQISQRDKNKFSRYISKNTEREKEEKLWSQDIRRASIPRPLDFDSTGIEILKVLVLTIVIEFEEATRLLKKQYICFTDLDNGLFITPI